MRKKNVKCEHHKTHKCEWDMCAPPLWSVAISPHSSHGRHDHDHDRDHGNVSVSVLQSSEENGCVYAVGCSTAHGHGVRVLQLHPLAISLCRRYLCFRVSAAALSLPSCSNYAVANERVRGVLTPLKGAEGVSWPRFPVQNDAVGGDPRAMMMWYKGTSKRRQGKE
jgi:hypothetical protein